MAAASVTFLDALARPPAASLSQGTAAPALDALAGDRDREVVRVALGTGAEGAVDSSGRSSAARIDLGVGGTPRTVLTELAAWARPLTREALDELPASKPLTHLRAVLVAAGALPARDEHLAQLERWISQTVAGRPDPGQKHLLHHYAFWHLLRRLRHRAGSGHATHSQAVAARSRINAAAAFLDWLTSRDLTLATCTHRDLDQWMIDASLSQHGQTGPFIRWARNQKLTSLTFPAARWTGPSRPIDAEGRRDYARRLLHDSTLKRRASTSPWLFPAGRPGRPISPCRRLAASLRWRLDDLRRRHQPALTGETGDQHGQHKPGRDWLITDAARDERRPAGTG